jgi:hypothetical protein
MRHITRISCFTGFQLHYQECATLTINSSQDKILTNRTWQQAKIIFIFSSSQEWALSIEEDSNLSVYHILACRLSMIKMEQHWNKWTIVLKSVRKSLLLRRGSRRLWTHSSKAWLTTELKKDWRQAWLHAEDSARKSYRRKRARRRVCKLCLSKLQYLIHR